MATIGDYKIVAGKKYKVYAVTHDKNGAEKDKRILKNRGYKSRIITDKDYKTGYGKPSKKYLIVGRK